jgi:hypothetical protein
VLAILLYTPLSLIAQTTPAARWRFNNRLQLLTENDSNVEEALSGERSARSLRFMIHSKIYRRRNSLFLQFTHQGGLQLYNDFAVENKLIDEVSGRCLVNITRAIKLGLLAYGRMKIYLNRDSDYAIGQISPYLQLSLPFHFDLQAGYRREGLDYSKSDNHDSRSPGFYLNISKQVAKDLTITPEVSLGTVHFDRPAYTTSADWGWTPKNRAQQDRLNSFGLAADKFWRGFLINISYRFEDYRSNSYGFDMNRHVVDVMFAKNIGGFLLRSYASFQKKTYLDDLLPFWPLELDTEKEESNFIILDISRDFPLFTLLTSLAWYKNESPWATLYYEKWLVNFGIEFRVSNP